MADIRLEFIWLGLIVLFVIIEALTASLTVIWFAAGSLAALICCVLGGSFFLQAIFFIIVSLICLIAVRPAARKRIRKNTQPTNADRIIGREAKVTEDIDNVSGKGAVMVSGVIWSAKSRTGNRINAGSIVRIVGIEGAKVFVEPL